MEYVIVVLLILVAVYLGYKNFAEKGEKPSAPNPKPVPEPIPRPQVTPTLPNGMSAPDPLTGAVSFAAVDGLFTPPRKWLWIGALKYTVPGSAAHACIAINCQNAAFAHANGMVYVQAYPAIDQHDAAAQIGAAQYRLGTTPIPNVNTIANTDATMDQALDFIRRVAAANNNRGDGGGFSPAR